MRNPLRAKSGTTGNGTLLVRPGCAYGRPEDRSEAAPEHEPEEFVSRWPVCCRKRGSLLGFPLLADGRSRREYALVYRAGFSNQPSPLKIGFRNKSDNFTHYALQARDDASVQDANIVPNHPIQPGCVWLKIP
jgi:hypothetical protein